MDSQGHLPALNITIDAKSITLEIRYRPIHTGSMISSAQLRAARALLGIDQRKLAELSGLSLPTIQRMEASDGVIRGNVDSLMKLVSALDAAGIELIAEDASSSHGGRGVRLKAHSPGSPT
jgi:helix-turn-helix protein